MKKEKSPLSAIFLGVGFIFAGILGFIIGMNFSDLEVQTQEPAKPDPKVTPIAKSPSKQERRKNITVAGNDRINPPEGEEDNYAPPLINFTREVFFLDDTELSTSYIDEDGETKTINVREKDSEGEFHFKAGNDMLVITAPHGRWDQYTDRIVKALCQKQAEPYNDATCLIAKYFRIPFFQNPIKPKDRARRAASGTKSVFRPDVNRPTDKATDGRCELQNALSRSVFENYSRRLPDKPKLYVEVHGFGDKKNKNRAAEVQYYGFKKADLRQYAAECGLNALVGKTSAEIQYTACDSRTCGMLGRYQRKNVPYLHIELPRKMRTPAKNRRHTTKKLECFIEKAYNSPLDFSVEPQELECR